LERGCTSSTSHSCISHHGWLPPHAQLLHGL